MHMRKVWFITGASSGFGRALTQAAVMRGDTVVAAARKTDGLDDLVSAHPDQVGAVALDAILAHTDSVRADLTNWNDVSRNTLVDQ